MSSWLEEQEILNEQFWREKYSQYNIDERIRYWSGQVYQSMRWQGESIGNEYEGVFDKEWWKYACEREPNFPNLWPQIARNARVDIHRANKLMGI